MGAQRSFIFCVIQEMQMRNSKWFTEDVFAHYTGHHQIQGRLCVVYEESMCIFQVEEGIYTLFYRLNKVIIGGHNMRPSFLDWSLFCSLGQPLPVDLKNAQLSVKARSQRLTQVAKKEALPTPRHELSAFSKPHPDSTLELAEGGRREDIAYLPSIDGNYTTYRSSSP